MRPSLPLLLTLSLGGLLHAADGGASIRPAPGFEPTRTPPVTTRQMPPMAMNRPVMSYEVESLVFTGDAAGLAAWSVLAAQGFHLVSSGSQDGKQILFFERMAQPTGKEPRLPAAVEANAELAAQTRATIQAIAVERQQAMRPTPPMSPIQPPSSPAQPAPVPGR